MKEKITSFFNSEVTASKKLTVIVCIVIIFIGALFAKPIMLYSFYGSSKTIAVAGQECTYKMDFKFYSERTFKNIEPGTTYQMLTREVGKENGRLTTNDKTQVLFYILSEKDRFALVELVPMNENSSNYVVSSVAFCNDKEIIEGSADSGLILRLGSIW